MDALYIILTATLIASSCAILGTFLMLRKMSMVGDAISHSVLPGIVIAYLIAGSRDSYIMLLGAAITGVLTTLFIEVLTKTVKVKEDASIGVVFTFLFSIGIILISFYTGQVDLDQDCVLYGEIAYVPLDVIAFGSDIFIPRALLINSVVFFVVVYIVYRAYKAFQLCSFNEDFARSLGINARFWHLLLMSLVSIVTVVAFESVGAILVVALLSVIPASIYLLNGSLKTILWMSVLIGFLVSLAGFYLASLTNTSIAGSITVCSGLLFAISFAVSRVGKKQRIKKHLLIRQSDLS
ncbi:MAG TPA: metal ABC transporter permease [Bacteroidia bacterium]|nr:metal ABC transporter permease [Bacteroidia bacterium]HNT80446.1 metal ABC transporter permease [Bacteroidia bacterium]